MSKKTHRALTDQEWIKRIKEYATGDWPEGVQQPSKKRHGNRQFYPLYLQVALIDINY